MLTLRAGRYYRNGRGHVVGPLMLDETGEVFWETRIHGSVGYSREGFVRETCPPVPVSPYENLVQEIVIK